MKSALRVGLLLDDSLDRPDGVQQYLLSLGGYLTENGHQVHYLVGETKREDIQNVHSLSRNLKARFNKNRLTLPLAAKPQEIQALLVDLKLDILHVQLPCHPLLGSRVIARLNPATAAVGTFHIMPSGLLSKTGTKLLGSLQRKTLDRFDELFAVSEPARDFAAKQYHAAIDTVIPNMVDIRKFKTTDTERPAASKRIVFLGRLVERKGCLYLLKALTELQQRANLPAYHVQIGGKGPLETKLKKFVINQGLQDRVHFVGFVDDEDKAAFLAQADIAVFPSTGGESFGIVLIEAMAAGAGVVLGGNNPGYQSVLGKDQPSLFDPKDTVKLADLLEDLLRHPAKVRDLHQEQQQRVKQFDVAVVGRQVTEAYYRAIAKRRRGSDNKVKQHE